MINIYPIFYNKKQYLDLLLLADEQESMIDRYLKRGDMFVLAENNEVKASCVITEEGKGIYEIKNIAVYPHTMLVGTGDSPITIAFYKNCGFIYSHRIPNFFTDNYEHPIFEAGKQLKDMIYLKISIRK